MNPLHQKALGKFLQVPFFFALLLFLPAGSLHYWQGWIFTAVFVLCTLAITIYLAMVDPQLLARRMDAGPAAEKEPSQKKIMTFTMLGFVGLMLVPALDHRFQWSTVPNPVVVLGNALVVLGFLATTLVMRANTFSASTIQISPEHRVISTGPYAYVRHPMYSGAFVLMVGMPLALGSWWGLGMLVPAMGGIVWRLLDEEEFLKKNLPGYVAYMQKVRARLVPKVW